MNILFVLEHFYPNKGGVERLFMELCKGLVQKGEHVQIVCTKTNDTQLSSEIFEGIHIQRLPLKNRFFFTFFSVFFLRPFALKADIIHTTSYNAALPAWIISFLCNKPCVITFHEVWGALWSRLPYYNNFQKQSFKLFESLILTLPFNRFIAVSDYTKKALIEHGVNSNRISRIYNGMSYERYKNATDNVAKTYDMAYYARLGPSKGLDRLLDALSKFDKPLRILFIISKEPAFIAHHLFNQFASTFAFHNIDIKYNVSDIELDKAIMQSSFVVIPSYSEGFCYNAIECSAMRIPIVVSAGNAIDETASGNVIRFQDDGLFVALCKALRNEWEYIPEKTFEIESMIEAYYSEYKTILHNKS